LGYEELIIRAISFLYFQPIWSWSTNVTDGRTDRRTDGRTTSNRFAPKWIAR